MSQSGALAVASTGGLQQEILSRIVSELKQAKSEDGRLKAANDLRDHVIAVSREVTGEAFVKFINDINRRIFELVHSQDLSDKTAGILAIDRLVDFESDEDATKITRFANYLRHIFPATDLNVAVLAAKALGRLALSGGTLTAEFVEFETKRALEWLQGDRQENKRLSAVLILKELACSVPTLIYSHVPNIIDNIWIALRDPKLSVREYAAQALSACLDIIQQRENMMRGAWYRKLLDETNKGFKSQSPEHIHASLLCFGELLPKSGHFMDEYYGDIVDTVLKFRDHKDIIIRKAVVQLIPVIAEFQQAEFLKNYLNPCMSHLLAQLKKEKDRPAAFLAVGKLAICVGSNISPYLEMIMVSVRDCFSTVNLARKSKAVFDFAPVFSCISMLAIAVGQALTKHIHEPLDQIFAFGLNLPFCQAMIDLSSNIPPLLPIIQEKLLNMIAFILSGHSFQPPGSPDHVSSSVLFNEIREIQVSDTKDPELITLALSTLGHDLNEFVRDVVAVWLDDEDFEIRKGAVMACCQVLLKDPPKATPRVYLNQVISDVLDKLLIVGVADGDSTIRYTVLSSLDQKLDPYLVQAENIRTLFIALNDESFPVREVVVSIIGRLSNQNPAYVLPSLRKTLIQLLTEMEYSGASRNKEECARLLCLLVAASQKFMKPYVEPVLKVLLPKLKDQSPGVAAQLLNAVGELSVVGREELIPHMKTLMPIIIDTIQDQSSSMKREVALRTLGKLAQNTTSVIDPYLQYPNLLTIIMNILNSEQIVSIRREAVKVVGILGALDPYRHKIATQGPEETLATGGKDKKEERDIFSIPSPSQNEDFYPTVAVHALLKILKDPSLSVHHTAVVQAIMYIFKILGMKCVPFLSDILPPLLHMMKMCPMGILEFHFQQLGILVSIVKQHIRNYLEDIFMLIREHWNPAANIQITITGLVETIALALDSEFTIYLPMLLSHCLQVFDADVSEKRLATQKVLHAFTIFGSNLEQYLHLVIPAIVKLFEKPDLPLGVRKYAIQIISTLSKKINFCDHASRIIHPLARVLQTAQPEVRQVALETLCALVRQLGPDYVIFIPTMNKIMIANKIQCAPYDALVSRILKNEPLLLESIGSGEVHAPAGFEEAPTADIANVKKLPVNQQHLRKSWETSQRSTKEDWVEWIRRLSVELLKESPSHALRACASLAGVHYPLAKELFNAAFVSCWTELYDQFQDEFVRSLEAALTSPTIPPEILQTLLNLAEFMERDEKALPIDIRTLGAYAAKCHAYAKALHYKELEFMNESTPDTIEALISINNQLQQPDAAIGILTYAQQNHDVELKESWYEKLQRWDDALNAYEKRQQEDPDNFSMTLGRMRCLHALGEWEQLSQLAQEKWYSANEESRRIVAPLAAAAAWGLANWELMDDYISVMKPDTPDGAFFRAILAVHRNQHQSSQRFINKTRDLLDIELKALVGESYSRAYNVVVRVQMLAELEEINIYKLAFDQPEKQAVIRKTWMKRLKGCQRNVEVWQRILKVRSLVVSPQENMQMWIKFANLCRKSGRPGLSLKILNNLMGVDSNDSDSIVTKGPPQVVYAFLKHQWECSDKTDTVDVLEKFLKHLSEQYERLKKEAACSDEAEYKDVLEGNSQLLARCHLRLAEWKGSIDDNLNETLLAQRLRNFSSATKLDKTWYKAWHAWALANFQAISLHERTDSNGSPAHELNKNLQVHVIPAVQGFFKSISLSKNSSLQDTLRLLTIWFKYGYQSDVNAAIAEGINTLSIDVWLQVIPQLIARIHAPNPQVRRLIHQLLSEIGKEHPQALVYSLTVASKSQNAARRASALAIMEKIRVHSSKLVEQALLVSQELIRVAILWHEMWHEGLEEASRLYFGDHNIPGMFAILEPLHQMLERGPETLREISFNQAFGRDLHEAQDWCRKYKRTNIVNDLNQAWDLYYMVFRRINKQLPQLTTLELQYVSPKLLEAADLELAVPGTYRNRDSIIRIASFAPTLTVITSKQRPRKLSIFGSDGNQYQYLLKGHEDLRQDERVMQLFGLVNTLLADDPETFKRHLGIQRYPVIPLSPNSGLIGWVPHCDTLHALIRDYRENKKILLNVEHRLMLQMAPDYDNLTVMQKVEVFKYAMDQTDGKDLYKVLWLKSKNSEAWLDRRTNYARSLAVMSMVGYVLGLGDRHPSNLMLDRESGKIIHIDFGDCFEVAMNREKFPEKIPFRLTRMLVNALEVSGLEGTFRTTCENVMRVLRENKDNVMAVLEAFVYDPLINWRLLNTHSPKIENKAARAAKDIHDSADLFSTETGKLGSSLRRMQRHETDMPTEEEESSQPEALNARAVAVIHRVSNKLTGRDFKANETLAVAAQVERLIGQATSVENLCQCYIGWCPFLLNAVYCYSIAIECRMEEAESNAGSEESYEVEAVVDKRVRRNRVFYCVKWLGYPSSENSWLPADELDSCRALVLDYERSTSRTGGRSNSSAGGSSTTAGRTGGGRRGELAMLRASGVGVVASAADKDVRLLPSLVRVRDKTTLNDGRVFYLCDMQDDAHNDVQKNAYVNNDLKNDQSNVSNVKNANNVSNDQSNVSNAVVSRWVSMMLLEDHDRLIEHFEHNNSPNHPQLALAPQPQIPAPRRSPKKTLTVISDDENNTDDNTHHYDIGSNVSCIDDDDDEIMSGPGSTSSDAEFDSPSPTQSDHDDDDDHNNHLDNDNDNDMLYQKEKKVLNDSLGSWKRQENAAHFIICVECHKPEKPNKKLYTCEYCSFAYHASCLNAPLSSFMHVQVGEEDEHDINDSEDKEMHFICEACSKVQPLCRVCAGGQEDNLLDDEECFFRCTLCYRVSHYDCLMHEGMWLQDDWKDLPHRIVPKHMRNKSDLSETNLFLEPIWDHYLCWECRAFGATPERLLARRTRPRPLMNLVYTETWTPNDFQAETERVEYLTKFRNKSHWWVRWVSGDWLASMSRSLIPTFKKRFGLDDSHDDAYDMHVKPFCDIDRLLSLKKFTSGTRVLGALAYVKWNELSYDESTWEYVHHTDLHFEALQKAIQPYDEQQKINSQPNRTTRDGRVHDESEFKELKVQPSYIVGGTLIEYQLEGLNWLLFKWFSNQSCILADEMGLGKTVQAISVVNALFHMYGYFPHIVIVPNATLKNWSREFAKWAPKLHVTVVHGNVPSRDILCKYGLYPAGRHQKQYLKTHVVLVTYETCLRDASILNKIKWETMIVDEAHRLKDRKTKLFKVVKSFNEVYWKLFLTGTPLQNAIGEYFNLMNILDPENFGDLDALAEKYQVITRDNVPELHELIKPYLLRRMKSEVLADRIPDKIEWLVPCSLSLIQKDLYKKLVTKNFQVLKAAGKDSRYAKKTSLNNILVGLRKLVNHPYLIQGGMPASLDQMSEERQHKSLIESCGKLVVLHFMLRKLQERGRRVLLFSTSTALLDILEDYLAAEKYLYTRLDGSHSAQQKQEAVDAFNHPDSTLFLFLLSTRAGGLGINLTSADTIIMYDADFNPHMELQAAARAHRIGQEKKVRIFRLVTKNTVEEKIIEVGKRKLVIDHLVIEKMGEPDLEADEIDSILRFGAESLFQDTNDASDSDEKPVGVDEAVIEKMIDAEQGEDEMEKKEAKSGSFSFAKVWKSDGTQYQDTGFADPGDNDDFWDKLLKDRVEAEQRELEASRADHYGRVDGKSRRNIGRTISFRDTLVSSPRRDGGSEYVVVNSDQHDTDFHPDPEDEPNLAPVVQEEAVIDEGELQKELDDLTGTKPIKEKEKPPKKPKKKLPAEVTEPEANSEKKRKVEKQQSTVAYREISICDLVKFVTLTPSMRERADKIFQPMSFFDTSVDDDHALSCWICQSNNHVHSKCPERTLTKLSECAVRLKIDSSISRQDRDYRFFVLSCYIECLHTHFRTHSRYVPVAPASQKV